MIFNDPGRDEISDDLRLIGVVRWGAGRGAGEEKKNVGKHRCTAFTRVIIIIIRRPFDLFLCWILTREPETEFMRYRQIRYRYGIVTTEISPRDRFGINETGGPRSDARHRHREQQ